jgi:hypothetical protein
MYSCCGEQRFTTQSLPAGLVLSSPHLEKEMNHLLEEKTKKRTQKGNVKEG